MRNAPFLLPLIGILAVTFFLPSSAGAWGGIGHRMVTETAALLVEHDQPEGWGPLLARHRFELGVYAIYPDAVFRHHDGKKGATETITHFFDLDLAIGTARQSPEGLKKLDLLPRPYAAAKAYLEAALGKEKAAGLGTSPWRTEQFMELAWNSFKDQKAVKGGYQRGETAEGDVKKIYQGLYYLGVLAHYSGDVTMPYHATADYNGWGTGQGGIHFYVEGDCVNALEPELSAAVRAEALKNRAAWLAAWKAREESPAGLIYRVYYEDLAVIERLKKLDREQVMLKPSDEAAKTFAKRKPPHEGCRAFRPVLITQLAKGAVLTADLWERVLPKDVDFSAASQLQFSDLMISSDYIEPDFGQTTFPMPAAPAPKPAN